MLLPLPPRTPCTSAGSLLFALLQTFIKDAKSGKNVNVLSKVKYVATTSGGSWFNSALSYTGPIKEQVPLDTFLGEVKQVRACANGGG
jgi:hypothetical protein